MSKEEIFTYLCGFVIAYLFGSIPWGFVWGKVNGIDIRKEGSGNVGATNVTRILGKKWGVICFLCDFGKGLLPVLATILLLKYEVIADPKGFLLAIVPFALFAGHVWSIYLKFKGGKGIATTAGIIVALAPLSLGVSGICWVAFFYGTRYVSLASVVAAFMLPLSAFLFSYFKIYQLQMPVLGLLIVLGVLAILKHTSNIKRLINGTENRFEKKNKSKGEVK